MKGILKREGVEKLFEFSGEIFRLKDGPVFHEGDGDFGVIF